MSFQNTTIIGNVGGEVRVNQVNGKAVANFSVAVNQTFGETEKTTWFDVALWGDKAQVAAYITTGRQVFIEGPISARAWIDGKGQPQSTLQLNARTIQLLGPKPEELEVLF